MEHVLVVAGSEKAAKLLTSLLSTLEIGTITTVSSGSEARRLVNETGFDYIFINAPLPDEFGHELAASLSMKANASVMMLVKGEAADEVSSRVEESGVFVVPKPINRAFFFQAVRLTVTARAQAARPAEGKRQTANENRGNPPRRPGQVRADTIFEHDGAAGAPLY